LPSEFQRVTDSFTHSEGNPVSVTEREFRETPIFIRTTLQAVTKEPSVTVLKIRNSLMLMWAVLVVHSASGYAPKVDYGFAPLKAIAGQPVHIQLTASPNSFSCASEYPLKEVIIKENIITLRYIHEVNPLVACILIFDPQMLFGPNFEVPALDSGTYEVYRNETYTCLQSIPACMIPEIFELMGTLTITAENNFDESFWYFNPVNPEPDTDFALQLLNPDKGSCNDYFTNLASQQPDGYISLSFVSRIKNPKVDCIVDNHPNGPQFAVEGMPKGSYNVFITELPPCAVCLPNVVICAICPIYVVPVYLGRITVGDDGMQTHLKQFAEIRRINIGVSLNSRSVTRTGLPSEWVNESVTLWNSLGKKMPVQISTLESTSIQIDLRETPPKGIYHIVIGNNKNNSRVLALPINVSD